MKERPILFSAPMVRALLNGTKTQTRRIVKPQPPDECTHYAGAVGTYSGLNVPAHYWKTAESSEAADDCGKEFLFWPGSDSDGFSSHTSGAGGMHCPYGSGKNCLKEADRLWVQEAFAHSFDKRNQNRCYYRADSESNWDIERWHPSIHMPRSASRITLEIVSVRVERLQDISEADAMAEGCPCYVCGASLDGRSEDDCHCFRRKASAGDYRHLWESINGAGSWDANPWVWVVEFKRAEQSA